MKLKLVLLLVFIALPVFAAPQKEMELIGYKHKGVLYGQTLPNGARDLGGGMLSDEDYGVSRFTKDGKYMLWFEKVTNRDDWGVPNWQVKDVLSFDSLPKNQQLLLSYGSPCRQNGRQNIDLIVKAEVNAAKKTYKVLTAWQANIKTERFESVPVSGIVCR